MTSDNQESRAKNRRIKRKKTEMSLILPTLGICFLLTPLINAFTMTGDEPGILSMVTYTFGIWGALIVGSLMMSRLLISEVPED